MSIQTTVSKSVNEAGKLQILVTRMRVTNFTAHASESATYPEHVFIIRRAPSQSKFAGMVACEIHCPLHMFATTPMTAEKLVYSEVERITFNYGAKWKLLRFTTSTENAQRLAELCSQSSKADVANETAFWLGRFDAIPCDLACPLPVNADDAIPVECVVV